MLAHQTGYGANGKQNFLFPLTDLYLTQGYGTGTYSHDGTYAMDFDGYYNGISMANAPYFAPFDCTCVAHWGSNSQRIVWTSDQEVNFIDGTVGIATIEFTHDNNAPNIPVGTHCRQGDVIGHTGTLAGSGTVSDHVHIEAKKGVYENHVQTPYYYQGNPIYKLKNSQPLTDLIGVNNTQILHTTYRGTTYVWNLFEVNDPEPPSIHLTRKRFPWYLIADKLQKRRILTK